MTSTEFNNQFDVLYNNITSNQAPGLNTYEKCVFLTKAQDEVLKNYLLAQSNPKQAGFDDNQKRQVDFSSIMETTICTPVDTVPDNYKIDPRSKVFSFPSDALFVVNEALWDYEPEQGKPQKYIQVIPLRYDEYTRLMSKPYKRPLKNQAWRLLNSGNKVTDPEGVSYPKFAEIITTPEYDGEVVFPYYKVRYVRKPKPIIIGSLEGLTIDDYCHSEDNYRTLKTDGCELSPVLHDEILQRAVELAKVAWATTGQDNTEAVLAAGQRSE